MYDTVGAMYVRVLSDTSGIKGELERDYGDAGKKAAAAFNRTFQNDLNKRLTMSQAFGALDKRIKTWAQKMATEIGQAADFSQVKFDLNEVISAEEINKLSKRLRIPAQELADYLAKAMPDALRAAQKEQEAAIKRLGVLREQEAAEERKRIKALADFERAQWAKSMGERLDETERLIKETYTTLSKENDKFQRDYDRSWRGSLRNIDLLGGRVGALQGRLRRAGTGGWFDSLTNALSGILGLAFKVGKVVPATFARIGGSVAKLGTRFAGAGGPLGQFGNVLVQMGGTLGKLGKGGPAALAAIAVAAGIVQAALGSIVVLVNTLAAGVVALSSALFYAVSNAALLVPIMGALGVGFAGAAIGAIDATQAIGKLWVAVNETDPKAKAKAWDAYNRELAKLGPNARSAVSAMKPLVEQFSELKKQAGEALFEGMADSLKKASPLVESVKKGLIGVAGAVGDVVDGFLALAQNTTFMASFNKMWELSAKIIRDVGSIATNVFAGFTNFFAAISPVVEQFTGKLALVAENFRKWTETKEGQASILQFFRDAYEIGSQVWEVIKNLGLALFDLFTAEATKGAAKDLLGFMNSEIKKFRDWINEVSENGKLQEWFDDAKEIGKQLWQVVKDIGKALAGLNTEENKEIFKDLMFLLRVLIGSFRVMSVTGSAALRALLAPIRLVRLGVEGISTAIQKVIDWWRRLRGQKIEGGGGGSWGAPPARSALSAMETRVGPTASIVTNNWNIVTPGMDSRVVASQVMNRMAVMAG